MTSQPPQQLIEYMYGVMIFGGSWFLQNDLVTKCSIHSFPNKEVDFCKVIVYDLVPW